MKLDKRVDSPKKPLIPLRKRVMSIIPIKIRDRIGDFGEEIFHTLVELKLGWTGIKNKRLDDAGIDRTFRLMSALIDTQIKTATMSQAKNWTFTIFEDKPLDIELYGQPNFYLILIGLHCKKFDFPEFLKHAIPPDPLQIEKTILMIPGKRVIKRFKGRESGGLTISYEKLKKKEYKWLHGTDNPFEIFVEEYKRQTGKEMPIVSLDTYK